MSNYLVWYFVGTALGFVIGWAALTKRIAAVMVHA